MSSDEARAEAERRMREQRESVGLMVVEQTSFIEIGFILHPTQTATLLRLATA